MSNLTLSKHFTQEDYEIVERTILYEGVFRLVRNQIRFRLFDGDWSQTVSREVLERMSAAAILPYDPHLDQVVLIEQFRPGALAQPSSPWLLEVVAGVYSSNEKPDEVAIREAQEEAACEINEIQLIQDYFVSPGGSNEYLHLFCGKVNASAIGGIHGLKSENEDIRAFALPAEDAFKMLQRGEIKTAPAIIALQWLQLNRAWLKALWQ